MIDWDMAGQDWNTTRQTSLQFAVDSWRTNTDWNPDVDTATPQKVFIDGTDPPCDDPWSISPFYAFNCDDIIERHDYRGERYDDVEDSDIYLNKNGYDWEYGSGGYDPSDPRVSFRVSPGP